MDIIFFDRVDLEGIYIEDKIKDTLLYSELIHINIADFSLKESFVNIDVVELNNAVVHLKKYKGDSTFNFQHIADYFASDSKDTTSSNFKVNVEKIALNNVNFVYQDENNEPTAFGLDYSNLNIQHLSGEFSDFSLQGDEIRAKIANIRFRDHSGFVLSKLSTELLYSPTLISMKNLRLGFNNSLIISDQLDLQAKNGSEDFADFVHNVRFQGNIRDSKINMADIAYFAPTLYGMDVNININNIDISGPVYGMKLNKTDITMLNSTIIRGDFQIPDIDHIDKTFIDDKIDLFQTSIADIESIKLTPFLDGEEYIDIPQNIAAANIITLKNGHFTGYLNEFVVDGDITSGLGNLSSEYGLKFWKNEEENIYYYICGEDGASGKDIIVDKLNLGALTGNDMLGITSGHISIGKGSKGLSMDELDILFVGKFHEIELNDYVYNNIQIKKGKFAHNIFTGVVEVEDDNLALTYDGTINLNGDMRFDFDVKIDSAVLAELNNKKGGVLDRFESKIKVSIEGTSLEEIKGTVEIVDLEYRDGEIDFKLDSMLIKIARHEIADSIIIQSELLDLSLIGKFDLTDMWPVIQNQLARVANNLVDPIDVSKSKNEFFDLEMTLKDVNPLMQFVDTNIYIAKNSTIKSNYNLKKLKLKIKIKSDSVKYQDMVFTDIKLENHFDSIRANVIYEIGYIRLTDSLAVKNAAIFSYVKSNKFSTNVGWDGSGSVEPALFAFSTLLKENKDVYTEFKPSFFFLKSNRWKISPDSKLMWNSKLLEFTNFNITNGDHLVNLEGKVSKNPKDWLLFKVRDFDLADLNGLTGGTVELGGILNIDGGVSDVYNNIRFMSMSDIKGLMIEGEMVGDLFVDNKWNKEKNSVDIKGKLKREEKETFNFSGNYFTERKKDNLDLVLNFDYTDIGFLNAFSDPLMYKDIEGLLNGELKIKGELTDPIITGKLDVVTANVMVPMFNVSFGISGEIDFADGEIIVDFMNVYDQEGNNAIAAMQIYHYDWADWNFDITLDIEGPMVSERFLVMDTYYNEGDFYYGKAYISGDVNIFGYNGVTEITVNATTEDGTDLILAMYGTGNLEESSFIVYDSIVPYYGVELTDEETTQVETTGLIMNLNFDITKAAKTTIIFDPVFHDQIEVQEGEGKLQLNLDEFGEMDMFGKYTILKGDYFMRVKGLVSKDFQIRTGSNLSWTGSPYDAIIDINADYRTNVSLEPILPPGIEDQGGKEPIVATLNMGRSLMDPTISFAIEAPEASTIGKAAIKAIQADQDQLNKQFFSLLALNKFLPTNGGTSGSGGAAYDFAENQINAILDNVGDSYDIAAEIDAGKAALDFQTKVGEKVTIITSLGVVSGDEESTSSLIGDVRIEYKMNDDGTFTLNAFNESNQGSDAEKGPFTQGVSAHYEETFNTTKEFKLLQGFLNIFRKKENDVDFRKNKSNGKKKVVKGAREKLDTGIQTDTTTTGNR